MNSLERSGSCFFPRTVGCWLFLVVFGFLGYFVKGYFGSAYGSLVVWGSFFFLARLVASLERRNHVIFCTAELLVAGWFWCFLK